MGARVGAVVLAAVAVAALLVPAPATGAQPGYTDPSPQGCDWPRYGRDLGLSFSQPPGCSAITPLNVATLRPKWFMPAPDSVSASAAVVDGVVYIGDWEGTFYALPADGSPVNEPLWTYVIDDTNNVSFGRIVSSAAVADVAGTRVVLFGGGATLYVLDAATGAELARACLDPRADPAPPAEPVRCRGSQADIEIESSPAVVQRGGVTRVLVGMSVHNRRDVGRTGLVSLRLRAEPWRLTPEWKFDPETELVYTTDPSRSGRPGYVVASDPITYDAGSGMGCGGVWSSPAVDLDEGLVFFGTANCNYDDDAIPAGETAGEGVWAVDLDDGRTVWSFLPRGNNNFDDDFGASPNLLPGGLVGIGGKDGAYYAFRRRSPEDAQPVWVTQAGQPGRINNNFSIGGVIGTPALGTVFDEPAVFMTTAISTPFATPVDGGGNPLDLGLATEPPRMLSLHAISAVDGRVLWRSPVSRQSYGAPTYARGVLYVPSTFSFNLLAFDADTGVPLWTSPLPGPPSSAPVVVGDSVYVGVGTRTSDLEYKAFGGDALTEFLGASPLSLLAGVVAFELAVP
jgi:outer membrane protein assembly factor BamB